MRRDRCFWIAGFVVLAALIAGCSAEQAESPAAPAPTAAPSSAPTSPVPSESPDPYAIPENPAEIDEAYVERVLEALSESTAAAAREVARNDQVTPRAVELLAASYRAGPSLDGAIRAFRRALKRAPGQDIFSKNATRIVIEVQELINASETCVFASALQDTSGLGGEVIEPFVGYFHIEPKKPDEDPDDLNPTPWMIVAEVGEPPRGKEYENPCA